MRRAVSIASETAVGDMRCSSPMIPSSTSPETIAARISTRQSSAAFRADCASRIWIAQRTASAGSPLKTAWKPSCLKSYTVPPLALTSGAIRSITRLIAENKASAVCGVPSGNMKRTSRVVISALTKAVLSICSSDCAPISRSRFSGTNRRTVLLTPARLATCRLITPVIVLKARDRSSTSSPEKISVCTA